MAIFTVVGLLIVGFGFAWALPESEPWDYSECKSICISGVQDLGLSEYDMQDIAVIPVGHNGVFASSPSLLVVWGKEKDEYKVRCEVAGSSIIDLTIDGKNLTGLVRREERK